MRKAEILYQAITLIIIVLLFYTPLSGQKQEELKFVDAEELSLIGKGFEKSIVKYGRIPDTLKDEMRKELLSLGENSAGIAVRFCSNSSLIAVRWKLINNFSMNHMPSTGIKGLDLYALDGKAWRYAGTARPAGLENFSVFIKNMTREHREYVAYFPLYDGVTSVEIGVEPDAFIGKPQSNMLTKREEKEPIVFYGTSITQGGCASRPGMAYPAILGRMLDRETINLGFSGNGRLDYSMAKAIAMIKAHAVVIDCLPNTNTQMVKERAYDFVKLIALKDTEAKVYMISNPGFPDLFLDNKSRLEIKEEDIAWREIYEKLRKEGIKNIRYIRGDKLLGTDGETTVDGVHFTDLGFMRFAKNLLRYIK
jgi:hypothetical protein